jgi:microcystin-dependent protein
MSEPFISEIRMMSFNFAPKSWALCNGQAMAINQNQALFSLLGTAFGGNGQTTFALPNLQGRVPTHTGGQGHFLGEAGGEQAHTLSLSEMPQHTHLASGTSLTGDAFVPTGNVLAPSPAQLYGPPTSNLTTLIPSSVSNFGGNQAHENMQPYLTISFCIALQGIFPSRD